MDSPPEAKKRPSPAVSRSNSNSTGAKLFRCFKPAAVDDGDGGDEGKRGSDEPLFAYAAAEENDGHALQKITPADTWDDDCGGKKKKKKKGLKLFWRASMAGFLEASLAKKMPKRKSTKNSHESINNLSTKADRILKLMHQNSGGGVSDNDNVRTTESDASTSSRSSIAATFSPSLGSSRSSSTNSSLRGKTKSSTPLGSFNSKSKQIQLRAIEDGKEQRPSSSDNSAICLLLLTLLVLVLWGKVCAIVCTSTWLFFVPPWSITKCTKSPSEENGDDSSTVDSAEYKKKIILEGLLQRKRSRGTAHS